MHAVRVHVAHGICACQSLYGNRERCEQQAEVNVRREH